MLTIDGAYGEGGGQIVRNAVALSALTGEPVTVTRIRARRKNPGLAAQHVAAIRAVACTCDAEHSGLTPGSDTITFFPGALKACKTTIAVGTAGSIPLVIQAWLTVALRTGGSLRITGGTEVPKSPTIDYLDLVLARVLRAAGAEIRVDILKRGYYPSGGGEVFIDVRQRNIAEILPGEISDAECGIVSCSSNLPGHIAERQASAAAAILQPKIGACRITLDRRSDPATGTSCTIWRGAKGGIALGRRGVPAEKIGGMAAEALVEEISMPGSVDQYLSDQLLVPLALHGGLISTGTVTCHAETTLWLLSQFGYSVEKRMGKEVEYSA